MMPDIEEPKPEGGSVVDLAGDGLHKIYMHRGQLDVYNFGSRHTKLRCARGWGKTFYLGVYNLKCILGLRRMIGLFLGASAKQLYTRTMPNMLKAFNQLGYPEGVFYFLGQAPAKLRWDYPLAKPRVWESCIHMQNGAVIQAASMAVKGSCNGINAAWLCGDESKYLPWARVKEEAFPTLRGDLMPKSATKTELKRWGYGHDPKVNNYYCSSMFVSDAGLTQSQCQWENEEDFETPEINARIAQMLGDLRYLEKHNPKMAVQLAQNENFLRQLHLLRSQSCCAWNWSSLENLSLLGSDFVRVMQRSLPDLLFRIQILGQKKGVARDGWYSNFSELNTYVSSEVTDFVYDKYNKRIKGETLDAQRWPTSYETETLDFERLQEDGTTCAFDSELGKEPLRIAIDANANLNCMVVAITKTYQGKPSVLVIKEFFVTENRRLRSLVHDFNEYFKPYKRRVGGKPEVIFYYTSTIKQGASTAYAVEDSEDSRFDRVVANELTALGWDVTLGEIGAPWRQERKYQFINDCLSFHESPAIYINREAGRCQFLLTAIDNAGVVPGTFKKDKSHEKLKATDPDSLGGDPRTRTDITDAFDDLIIGIKVCAENHKKIGGGLRNKFQHLAGIPR